MAGALEVDDAGEDTAGVDAAGVGVEVVGVGVAAVVVEGALAVVVEAVVAAGLAAGAAGAAAGAASVTVLVAPAAEAAAPLAVWATDCVVVGVGTAIAVEVPAALAFDRPKTQQIANITIAAAKPAKTADERVPKRVMDSAEYPGRLHNDRKLQVPTITPTCFSVP